MKRNVFEKGFTLIEVMTSIFIIVILTTVVLLNYRQNNLHYALSRSANKLAQDIRRAQQMAMSMKECCEDIVPKGYGIYLQAGNTYYYLYADISGSSDKVYDGGDVIIDTVPLESGVSIQSVNPASPLSINFNPPDPTTTINGDSTITDCTITLSVSSQTKNIYVNKFGMVEIQ